MLIATDFVSQRQRQIHEAVAGVVGRLLQSVLPVGDEGASGPLDLPRRIDEAGAGWGRLLHPLLAGGAEGAGGLLDLTLLIATDFVSQRQRQIHEAGAGVGRLLHPLLPVDTAGERLPEPLLAVGDEGASGPLDLTLLIATGFVSQRQRQIMKLAPGWGAPRRCLPRGATSELARQLHVVGGQ